VEGYRFRHGDAVAIGMVYVAELARLAGRLDEQTCALHRTVLASVGLPTAYPAGVWPSLREAMGVDKKARGGRLRLVDGLPPIPPDPANDPTLVPGFWLGLGMMQTLFSMEHNSIAGMLAAALAPVVWLALLGFAATGLGLVLISLRGTPCRRENEGWAGR